MYNTNIYIYIHIINIFLPYFQFPPSFSGSVCSTCQVPVLRCGGAVDLRDLCRSRMFWEDDPRKEGGGWDLMRFDEDTWSYGKSEISNGFLEVVYDVPPVLCRRRWSRQASSTFTGGWTTSRRGGQSLGRCLQAFHLARPALGWEIER